MSSNNHKSPMEHRDFWDSLQLDILSSNQDITNDDFLTSVERSFMFSLFFRGCSALEVFDYKKALGLKDNAYVILLELLEHSRGHNAAYEIDEFLLHRCVKEILKGKSCAVGPILTKRLIILISEDSILSKNDHREESQRIFHELAQVIEQRFHCRVAAGIGSIHSIHSIFPSFTDALNCLYFNASQSCMFYQDLNDIESNTNFDYLIAEKHLLEAVRLRKPDAYDYFGLLMDWLKPFNDATKRSKLLELLVLTNHTISLDNHSDIKALDYLGIMADLMNYDGDQLIDYGSQLFIYITSYVKQPSSIDYSNHIVKATKEYLENHYSDDISLEDMAGQVNISPQYFSKLIKKTTGFNFIDWVSMLRVKKAKELLTNSNLTVKEVCFMVGYKDPNYFSRIFKKRIGITPSEYIKANSFINSKS